MPIRINFLTEAIAAEEMRRRDPVKRTLFLGALLIALTFVWYSSTILEYKISQSKLATINEQIQTQTNQYNQVLEDLRSLGENKRRLEALQTLTDNRFLQGNLLEAMQKIYVPNVQLLRLKLDQSYAVQAGAPAKSSGQGGRPGAATESITLFLDAKDSSVTGDQVNRYKEAIADYSYFKSNQVNNANIRLANLSPSQTSINGKPFVLFTLECRYPVKTR